ncbi:MULTISPECIES: MlaE family ABC transporter permease [Komagataeibacter]|uniref:ABC transporter n=2 Tax=Komagataeibacter TaxID=1434011 RepID=A0A0D6Q5Q6_KOMXY|nr:MULTISPECIES: ABC transporter permease [Komagataeibacter]MBL7232825.1 ABC transporter permease [Komagataeibacter oboediens]MBT0675568.1 ABC transporter permease [Komagataeibacter oboediens]MBT0679061.1 ABC transporter permease [Komagataeibacter oboediens]MBV0889026.1 ABC transporter permease [Komagataeibacter oboediens]MBV1823302.1 ABC transporter permease [Komagataeibacter oboediens]
MTDTSPPAPDHTAPQTNPFSGPQPDDAGRFVHLLRRFAPWLAAIGRLTRHQIRFTLLVIGAGWGTIRESLRPNSWRRPVIYEFRASLRQVVSGGFLSIVVTATLTGLMVVSQAAYWLGFAGMAQMTGSILVSVLVREISPILVGIILMGRSGMLSLTEIGMMVLGGEVRALQARGIDPFLALVMPRTFAFTLGGFTLGMIFAVVSLLMGFVIAHSTGAITTSVWTFFFNVLAAMTTWDYLIIPLKFVLVGFFVGLGACISGLTVSSNDTMATIMPRGFARGIMLVLVVNVLFMLDF